MNKLLLLSAFIFMPMVHASDCTQILSSNVIYTHLLNAAFSPYLIAIHNEITAMSAERIQDLNRKYAGEVGFRRAKTSRLERGVDLGFDSAFIGERYIHGHYTNELPAPYNKYNEDVMARLGRAVYLVATMVRKNLRVKPETDRALSESFDLRCKHTYAGDAVELQMYDAYLSVLQAAAQLTSDPVEGLNPEQLLYAVMSQQSKKPSLMVQLALMMRPKILGENGNYRYFADALDRRGGEITFSSGFRAFQKRHRDEFLAFEEPALPYELGHGCPVAHVLPGGQKPGLQYLLDSIMYVYAKI